MTFSGYGDTPDWTNAIVNPQVLLATVPAGNSQWLVQIPANTESLLVICHSDELAYPNLATGGVSGSVVTFVRFGPQYLGAVTSIFVCPVTPPVDESIWVYFEGNTQYTSYIVADAGVRATVDYALFNALVHPGDGFGNYALVMAGSDGSFARTVLTDANGTLLRQGPNLTVLCNVSGNVIAAPTNGVLRLDSADLYAAAANTSVTFLAGGVECGVVAATAAGETDHCNFGGFKTTGAISVSVGGNAACVLRYSNPSN